MDGRDLSSGEVQGLSIRIARGLERSAIAPGEKVAILSGNDPIAFACVFGISRAAAVWCPINPRNEATENKFILDQFDCSLLLFHSSFAPMVEAVRRDLPKLRTLVCLDTELPFAPSFDRWLGGLADDPYQRDTIDDLAMIPGTGGTTGQPKGVMLVGAQHRGDDRADPDGLSVQGPPGLSRSGAADPCRRCAVFSDHDARWPRRDHAPSRHRRVPRPGRDLPRHAHVPAADRDLHAARSSRPRSRQISVRCNASGMAPRRSRRRGSRRR